MWHDHEGLLQIEVLSFRCNYRRPPNCLESKVIVDCHKGRLDYLSKLAETWMLKGWALLGITDISPRLLTLAIKRDILLQGLFKLTGESSMSPDFFVKAGEACIFFPSRSPSTDCVFGQPASLVSRSYLDDPSPL